MQSKKTTLQFSILYFSYNSVWLINNIFKIIPLDLTKKITTWESICSFSKHRKGNWLDSKIRNELLIIQT